MLKSLICDSLTLYEVARRFEVERGPLNALLSEASSNAANLVSFVREINEYSSLESLIAGFVRRLAFGVPRSLLPVMEIEGIKLSRARQLAAAGLNRYYFLETPTL